MARIQVPTAIHTHIYEIFAKANDKISRKLSLNPNLPEESLDISFIEYLSHHSAPTLVTPGWAVLIATHFIGRLRHYDRYEIADIGIVVVFKRETRVLGRKLVLLQSKRLYPKNNDVIEPEHYDYFLGLGLVTREDQYEATIFGPTEYKFDYECSYGALRARSQQCTSIQEHMNDTGVPVHYMLYNPLAVPWSLNYPVAKRPIVLPSREFGIRVIPASDVHSVLTGCSSGNTLKLKDLIAAQHSPDTLFGGSLEDFMDSVISCREGYFYDRERDSGLHRLFDRKSGGIFCVVEITIEQSEEYRP